jgi:hypothetical protein
MKVTAATEMTTEMMAAETCKDANNPSHYQDEHPLMSHKQAAHPHPLLPKMNQNNGSTFNVFL